MPPVAAVTGANKGIGFAIVRGLCKNFKGEVYLTARDEGRGRAAVEALEKEGLHPKFHQLDVEDISSIERFKDFLVKEYGGLDVLVNNAGFAYKRGATESFHQQAVDSIRINYTGTLSVLETMLPILRSGARVVDVSSGVSTYFYNRSQPNIQERIRGIRNVDETTALMNDFIKAAKCETCKSEGYCESAYGMSKVGVSLLTPFFQQKLDSDTARSDILINACCPGYVDTDMSSHMGKKTIDEGADTPLYLALLAPGISKPKGDFVGKREIADSWMTYKPEF